MIHYHGGPITPETCALRAWSGRHAFISFAHPYQIKLAASITQSFALDNGAFSLWKANKETNWPAYYDWCAEWLAHPACDWAVIPDVIDGSEAENDKLIEEWPHGDRGVPVWHLNESIDRFVRLAYEWPRVALGSSGDFDVRRPSACVERVKTALSNVDYKKDQLPTKLHGLRMLNSKIISKIPLSSGDSTNVARNIGIDKAWKGTNSPATKEARVDVLIGRIESTLTPHEVILNDQFDLESANA